MDIFLTEGNCFCVTVGSVLTYEFHIPCTDGYSVWWCLDWCWNSLPEAVVARSSQPRTSSEVRSRRGHQSFSPFTKGGRQM